MIPVGNIYYMLAYCFRTLESSGFRSLASEEFENSADLCAAILEKGISQQIRKGLQKSYTETVEPLSVPRGRIEVSASVKTQSIMNMQLVCRYDQFSVDTALNRMLKSTIKGLLSADIDKACKRSLRRLMPYFAEVSDISLHDIDWHFRLDRNNQSYRMLVFVCRLIVDGLIQSGEAGARELPDFIDDQAMCRLYERFILAYYRKEHPELCASASQVAWAEDFGYTKWLPIMQTDITLRAHGRTLIIDAKYYTCTMQRNYDVRSLHSGNLYQVFTYVKNEQAAVGSDDSPVAGMLLYAKTDEDLQPEEWRYVLSGNPVEVRTLDLSGNFESIRCQLDEIAERYLAF